MATITIPTEKIITAAQREAEAINGAWDALRAERDRRLAEHDWRLTRHYEESMRDGVVPTLTPEMFDALFAYRVALRDLPANTVDPMNPVWPEPPEFLAAEE